MKKFEGAEYNVEIGWDPNERPVYYVVARGNVPSARIAIEVMESAVREINSGPFDHVCAVYNLLAVERVPLLGRFLVNGRLATSKTAHIVLGTTLEAARLIGSVLAVAGGTRLRTLDVCQKPEEIEASVSRWLALPDFARERHVDKSNH